MANRRKYSPIFNASIKFGPVSTAETAKGVPYAKSVSQVTLPSGQTVERTVMAFGDQLAVIRGSLRKGRTVILAVQHDGGTLKAIGFPLEKVEAQG